MKTIIVATDFSAEADNAMIFAVEAVVGKQYKIVLFHLHTPSIHTMNARLPVEEVDRPLKNKREAMGNLVVSLKEIYGTDVAFNIAQGNFYEELMKCIEEHRASMVVAGMAEKSLEQDLLGNTTTSLIGKLKFPVLSVPLSAKYKGIKNILFACDIMRGVHEKIFEAVKLFAKDFNAKVEVFHVAKKQKELNDVRNLLEDTDLALSEIEHNFKSIIADEVIKSIKNESRNIEADILIMVPHKYSFWNSLLHKSKTKVMASGSNIPLLSLCL